MTVAAAEQPNIGTGARSRSRSRDLSRAAGFGAIVATLVLLLFFVVTNVQASLSQRSLRTRWDAGSGSAATRPGDPIAVLRVPSIGMDLVVAEGAARGAPIHQPKSAMPGEAGLSVIEGGRFAYGAVFGALDRLAVDDEILVQTKRATVHYKVIDTRRVDASAIDYTSGGDIAMLLLIAPADRFGGSERIVVRAREVMP